MMNNKRCCASVHEAWGFRPCFRAADMNDWEIVLDRLNECIGALQRDTKEFQP